VSKKTDDYWRVASLIQYARVHFDGHFTILRFTSNWRVGFGTPNSREDIDAMAEGKTFDEAMSAALDKDLLRQMQESRERLKPRYADAPACVCCLPDGPEVTVQSRCSHCDAYVRTRAKSRAERGRCCVGTHAARQDYWRWKHGDWHCSDYVFCSEECREKRRAIRAERQGVSDRRRERMRRGLGPRARL